MDPLLSSTVEFDKYIDSRLRFKPSAIEKEEINSQKDNKILKYWNANSSTSNNTQLRTTKEISTILDDYKVRSVLLCRYFRFWIANYNLSKGLMHSKVVIVLKRNKSWNVYATLTLWYMLYQAVSFEKVWHEKVLRL